MTILSVAYPLFPVAPDSGGGAEQILYLLDREITRAGHRSLVIAAQGSCISGELIQSTDGHLCAIERALRQHPIDLIHFHGLDFHNYIPETAVPMLATLHLPIAWYPESIFTLPHVKLNCVSQSQAAATGLPVVLNGIDTQRFNSPAEKKEYLFWLGRICPEKGVDMALRVAHRLDVPMVIAGPVHDFESHQQYFESEVASLLDAKRRYIGPVHGKEKSKLLAEARCLLVPSLVAETSSLVAMEAVASGTPVVALDSGALPEVVEHGVTGFIVDSEDEMVEAVTRIGDIRPEICRAQAATRFDARRMASDYLNLYTQLTSQYPAAR
ncbi:MAG: glycosyltransferase family 4 protein [Acidobacteriota bacterium]|nr:glycosyltransferase family 4 protein [Acidobacteriota bacterium]